jgi:hypothetical protein
VSRVRPAVTDLRTYLSSGRGIKVCALRGWAPLVTCSVAGGDCEKQCLSNGGARLAGESTSTPRDVDEMASIDRRFKAET